MKTLITLLLCCSMVQAQDFNSAGAGLQQATKLYNTSLIVTGASMLLPVMLIASDQSAESIYFVTAIGGVGLITGAVLQIAAWQKIGRAGKSLITVNPTGVKIRLVKSKP